MKITLPRRAWVRSPWIEPPVRLAGFHGKVKIDLRAPGIRFERRALRNGDRNHRPAPMEAALSTAGRPEMKLPIHRPNSEGISIDSEKRQVMSWDFGRSGDSSICCVWEIERAGPGATLRAIMYSTHNASGKLRQKSGRFSLSESAK